MSNLGHSIIAWTLMNEGSIDYQMNADMSVLACCELQGVADLNSILCSLLHYCFYRDARFPSVYSCVL